MFQSPTNVLTQKHALAGAMTLAPASSQARRLPHVDDDTPPLTRLGAVLLLVRVPLTLLRLFLLACVLFAWVLFLRLSAAPRLPAGAHLDTPRFRRYKPLVIASTFCVGRCAMYALGFRVRVVDESGALATAYASCTAAAVVVNHISYLDPFVVGAATGPYFSVANKFVSTMPLIGTVLRLFGQVPVDASTSVSASITDRACRTGCWDLHPPLLVFPEGTCTNGHHLLRFKTGGFLSGQPVMPVIIRYNTGAVNAGWVWRPRATRCSFYHRLPTEFVHLARLIGRPWSGTVDVRILPPYAPSAAEQADPRLFAAGVRAAMARALGVPLAEEWSAEDAKAFYATLRRQ